MFRAAFISMLLFASGCGTIPEGVFSCSTDRECPDRWFCRSDARCWSRPEGPDAAGLDAAVDDGGMPVCPDDCDDMNACTDDHCGSDTGFGCAHDAVGDEETCTIASDPCNYYYCNAGTCTGAWSGTLSDNFVILNMPTSVCCGGTPTNVTMNTSHCGQCYMVCAGGQTCFNRFCQPG